MACFHITLVCATLALATGIRLDGQDANLSHSSFQDSLKTSFNFTFNGSESALIGSSEGRKIPTTISSTYDGTCLGVDKKTDELEMSFCNTYDKTQDWYRMSDGTWQNAYDETKCATFDAFIALIGSDLKLEKCESGSSKQKWYFEGNNIHSRAGKCMDYDLKTKKVTMSMCLDADSILPGYRTQQFRARTLPR
mmetsp:Transcript_45/g.118  ORF Transcript_45/g.118 Transcript_45/m.118 type:complete len:194 (+) Transcript_45:57-638(+)